MPTAIVLAGHSRLRFSSPDWACAQRQHDNRQRQKATRLGRHQPSPPP
jgi:hypothetical protein